MTSIDLTRGVRCEPGFPKWQHRPAGLPAWKREDCRSCGTQIDAHQTGTHTLWVTDVLCTYVCCDECAATLTR